jgi:predicted transcriptional regulator
MSENYLLLSIQQKNADKIFLGTKRVELRKSRPCRLNKGDMVIVYVPNPLKAILGVFQANGVIEATPDELWEKVQEISGLSRPQFDSYYSESQIAFGIMVNEPCKLDHPITLSEIKNVWPDFHPPQIYQYLSREQVNSLMGETPLFCSSM